MATGYREPRRAGRPVRLLRQHAAQPSSSTKFASQDKRTETQTSILQALSLMNGKLVADATNVERSETLAAVADAPFLDTPGKSRRCTWRRCRASRSRRRRERLRQVRRERRRRGRTARRPWPTSSGRCSTAASSCSIINRSTVYRRARGHARLDTIAQSARRKRRRNPSMTRIRPCPAATGCVCPRPASSATRCPAGWKPWPPTRPPTRSASARASCCG